MHGSGDMPRVILCMGLGTHTHIDIYVLCMGLWAYLGSYCTLVCRAVDPSTFHLLAAKLAAIILTIAS